MFTPTCVPPSTAYTIAKYGMSMCVLGMAEELKPVGIAVNALWPRTGRSILCEMSMYVLEVLSSVKSLLHDYMYM